MADRFIRDREWRIALVVPHKPLTHAVKEYTKYFNAQGYPSALEGSDSLWVIQLHHKEKSSLSVYVLLLLLVNE